MQFSVADGVKEMDRFTTEQITSLNTKVETIHHNIKAQRTKFQGIQESVKELSQASEQTSYYLRHTLQETKESLENLSQSVHQLQAEMSQFSEQPHSVD
ncbi:hypothetical protein PN462_12340 [Spirulina sp. CS-785/01]|uniref:hypothetical protein n=1 Tax=Spirulina sp. CS-785/01 TaxID=3021716 RepID=UPI00232CB8E6|nr:hypothetical protein [Spirulina sp. CS-785/01]MDB9313893.1 hypothetical protein [Spirulina sp. CS-785/01]